MLFATSSQFSGLVCLATILSTASYASSQTLWIELSPVASSLNSTDDFLIPMKVGSNKQLVNLTPSLGQSGSFVNTPKACTPSGSSSPNEKCISYRGGVYDQTNSNSFYAGSKTEFNYENSRYKMYAKGMLGKDVIGFNGDNGAWELKDFEFGLIEGTNVTGMLGLGRDSMFLKKLYDDKRIGSRSYGLHVGIDIWNHPWPVLNPSFDESGKKPTTDKDYEFGKVKRQDKKLEFPVRESHKFPGSLTLGGYDKSKISNKTKPLTVPIADDGALRLSLTNVVARNILPASPFDLLNDSYPVIIDADTPHMHFPDTFSKWLGDLLGAPYGDRGLDFFYTSDYEDQEQRLGNVTMTFKAPDGSGDEIEILVPPTVWFQPIGYMRNMEPVGNTEGYNYYAPIKEFRGTELPIILGRSFLKAAYLFVNHDAKNFQISQVAFYNKTREIVPVSASNNNNNNNNNNKDSPNGNLDNKDGAGGDNESKEKKPIPLAVLGGAAGGGVLLCGALVLLIFFLRKKRKSRESKSHIKIEESRPGTNHTQSEHPVGGRTELDANAVAMVDIKRPTTSGSTHFSGLVMPPPSGVNELPQNNVKPVNELPGKGTLSPAPPVPELPSPVAPAYQQRLPTSPVPPQYHQNVQKHELGNQSGYHEMATTSPLPKQQIPTHTAMYPPPTQPLPIPPTPQNPYQRQHTIPPPPSGPPPFMVAGYKPPPATSTTLPAGYVPPPPPPGPPPQGSQYNYPVPFPGRYQRPSPNSAIPNNQRINSPPPGVFEMA